MAPAWPDPDGDAVSRFDLVISADAVLVNGARGSQWEPTAIGITDGVIREIGRGLTGDTEVTLPTGEILIPGLVDTHVHVNEPGRTEWEGFATATRAAAAGGVTTIIDMPLNSIPSTVDVAALEVKRQIAATKAIIDVGFWGGAVPDNLGTLRGLHDAGVFGFKSFLAPSGVDEFGHLDGQQLKVALAEIADIGGRLIVHAEDPGVIEAHSAGASRRYSQFEASRPAESENVAIERIIEGVRETGAHAHILHLSSASALPRIAAARAEGLPITVETCPHYLVFRAEEIADGATEFKCCPPIRDDANRDALWQGLVDGVIDVVVSDHSPSTPALKFGHDGDFQLAWGGISGLQVGLSAMWTEARLRGIALETVIGWMATRTADLVGLRTKGRIEVGAEADVVAFAPDATYTIDVDHLHHRNRVSAFAGRKVTGAVRRTWLAGQPVAVGPDAPPRGRLLSRPVSALLGKPGS